MKKTNGDMAFASGFRRKVLLSPADPGAGYREEITEPLHAGMSLRDYFAAKAMQAMALDETLTRLAGERKETVSSVVARAAYQVADAMLAERSRP